MVPDIDLQLRVVIKALRDVVTPAIDPGDRLAAEQLHLSIATLELVATRLPLVRRRVRRELANAIALAEAVAVVGKTSGLDAPLAAAREALDDSDVDTGELETHKVLLLAATSGLIDNSPDAASDHALARAVVAASKAQFDLVRAWCRPAGFEPDPHAVPSLENLLGEAMDP